MLILFASSRRRRNDHLNQFSMLISHTIQDNIPGTENICFLCYVSLSVSNESCHWRAAECSGSVIDERQRTRRSDEGNGSVCVICCRHRSHKETKQGCTSTSQGAINLTAPLLNVISLCLSFSRHEQHFTNVKFSVMRVIVQNCYDEWNTQLLALEFMYRTWQWIEYKQCYHKTHNRLRSYCWICLFKHMT